MFKKSIIKKSIVCLLSAVMLLEPNAVSVRAESSYWQSQEKTDSQPLEPTLQKEKTENVYAALHSPSHPPAGLSKEAETLIEETEANRAAAGQAEDIFCTTPSAVSANAAGSETGDFSVQGGSYGTSYTYKNQVLTILSGNTPLTISGKTTRDRIVVKAGITVDLTIRDLEIHGNGSRPFDMKGANVTLHLEGTNHFLSSNYKAALFCPAGSELTIEGPGILNAAVDVGGNAAAIGGESTANPSAYDENWKIWTKEDGACGKITINNGTVNALNELLKSYRSDYGVAIGGYGGGPIMINGGTVNATAAFTSTGIGSLSSDFEGITITGGTVTAKTINGIAMDDYGTSSAHGPAIGVAGGYGDMVPILISGGVVTAESNFGCAGIGGGRNGSGGTIHITGNAKVTAKGGYGGSGIGAGYAQNGGGSAGKITIDGNAVVNARGGDNASGIGGGAPRNNNAASQGDSGEIFIAGKAQVNARGGVNAPGIGSGGSQRGDFPEASQVNKIVITENAFVSAKGGAGSEADIGPGHLGALNSSTSNPSVEERFHELIITVLLPGNPVIPAAQNSLTLDEDGNYVVKGNVTLTHDLEIPEGKKLILSEGSALTIPSDVLFTCSEGAVEGSGQLIQENPSAEYFSVTFDSNGGSMVDPYKRVSKGSTILPPSPPVKQGFRFEGWYQEPSLFTLWNFDTDQVMKNITLYAKWTEEAFGLHISEIPAQTYTGKAVKPEVAVYFHKELLKEGKDYRLSYSNNIAAALKEAEKAPSVTITGKGNYKEAVVRTFTIEPKKITDSDLLVSCPDYLKYNQKEQTPVPVIQYNKKTLKKNKDFLISYYSEADSAFSAPLSSVKEAGKYIIQMEGKGNFTGKLSLPVEITENTLITSISASLNKKTVPYTGSEINLSNTPGWKLTVKHGSKLLKSDQDPLADGELPSYKISYRNNTAAGKASILITGIDKAGYSGTKEIPFTIQGVPISKSLVTKLENVEYTGSEQKPEPVLTIKTGQTSSVLVKDRDYTLEYTPAVSVGKVTVSIKGKNNYSGSMKKTYQIIPVPFMNDNKQNEQITCSVLSPAVQNKQGAVPEIKLEFRPADGPAYTLVKDKDYILTCINNKAVTTDTKKAGILIKGKGNFKGTLNNIPFDITQKDFESEDIRIEVSDMLYQAKKPESYAYKPKVSVYDNGVKLSPKEYEIDYGKNLQSDVQTLLKEKDGQILEGVPLTITVRAKAPVGNTPSSYTGSKTAKFYITPYSIKKAIIEIAPYSFNGYEIDELKQEDFTKCEYKFSKKDIRPLILGTDFEIISYQNNKNFGIASVTLRGTGKLYGGTKTVNFRIEKYSLKELLSNLFHLK